MNETPRIVLTGFMGAGKTTVARELARALACEALDLDEFIAAREGRTPRALIDEDGEAAFREIESRALGDALKTKEARVIALGGGAWAVGRNRAAVRSEPDCLTVWLDAPFDLCWERIEGERGGGGRPLGRARDAARRLFEERLASYRLARLHVRVTPGLSAAQLAARIIEASSLK